MKLKPWLMNCLLVLLLLAAMVAVVLVLQRPFGLQLPDLKN
jgi:hypothetical protein